MEIPLQLQRKSRPIGGGADAQSQRDTVSEALDRLLADPAFQASARNRKFLRYVVEEASAGRASRIKAYNIAVDVFGRGSDFDGTIDPIVRIEATRLRAALTSYYAGPGRDHRVQISLPRGGYVPFLQTGDRAASALPDVSGAPSEPTLSDRYDAHIALALPAVIRPPPPAQTRRPPSDSPEGSFHVRPTILVEPVVPLTLDARSLEVANGLSQSLETTLTRFAHLRIIHMSPNSDRSAPDRGLGRGRRASTYIIDSSVRLAGDRLRFWWRIGDAGSGETIWSELADYVLDDCLTIQIEDDIARKVANKVGKPLGMLLTS